MEGRCLCGAVRIRAVDTPVMHACHCATCRRWCGGPSLSVHCGADVDIDGHEAIAVFRSSEWAERTFCRHCGTHLFYRLVADNDHLVSAGLFQDGPEFVMQEQIFIDEKPPGYTFADDTPLLTGADVLARYGA